MSESVVAEGRAEVAFDAAPMAQIFPTNIPDNRRNRNWQHVRPGDRLGATRGTLPLSFLLFDRNDGDGKQGLSGVGVLSVSQLADLGLEIPALLQRFDAGLIVQDLDGDGALDPQRDRVIGGVRQRGPAGAAGQFAATPLAGGRLLLSQPTTRIDPQVGARVGGAVMDVLYAVGDRAGDYAVDFTLFRDLNDPASGDGSRYTYYVKAK
ncbi:MAG: hypothetical protein AAF360_19995 [Pseudomonadota bacterium]